MKNNLITSVAATVYNNMPTLDTGTKKAVAAVGLGATVLHAYNSMRIVTAETVDKEAITNFNVEDLTFIFMMFYFFGIAGLLAYLAKLMKSVSDELAILEPLNDDAAVQWLVNEFGGADIALNRP